jgi:DNA-binding Lrp family transcriptional regulator
MEDFMQERNGSRTSFEPSRPHASPALERQRLSGSVAEPLLSSIDRWLIARLQRDGRTPFSALAAELGISEATVQRRTQQLIDDGYFTIVGVVDPLRHGSGNAVLMGINATPHAIDTIGPALAEIPEARFVATVTGTFDVVCELVTSNRQRLTDILVERIPQIPGILAMNSSRILKNEKTNYLWDERGASGVEDPLPEERVHPSGLRREGYQLDDLDRGIISLLQGQGRMSYVELATRLNVTESTARRRTLRLLQSGYVKVVAIGNPFRLGFQEVVLIWLKVQLASATHVLTELARRPEIRYLSRVAGSADIVAEAIFPDQAALTTLIDGPLAATAGIREAALSFELIIHKRAYVCFDRR